MVGIANVSKMESDYDRKADEVEQECSPPTQWIFKLRIYSHVSVRIGVTHVEVVPTREADYLQFPYSCHPLNNIPLKSIKPIEINRLLNSVHAKIIKLFESVKYSHHPTLLEEGAMLMVQPAPPAGTVPEETSVHIGLKFE